MSDAFPPTVKTGQLKPHRRQFLLVHGGRGACQALRAPAVVSGWPNMLNSLAAGGR